MGYYIYKYMQGREVVYIGKTTDLNRRINDHTKDKLSNFIGNIYYFECANKTAMDSWEYCLINKYHPRHNVALNDDATMINITEPVWHLYKTIKTPITTNIPNKTKKMISVREEKLIRFKCQHCHYDFGTFDWDPTPKGYSTVCPRCSYRAWVSKDAVRRADEFKALMKHLENLHKKN